MDYDFLAHAREGGVWPFLSEWGMIMGTPGLCKGGSLLVVLAPPGSLPNKAEVSETFAWGY